jgi:UMP-CMP kinase
MAEQSIQIIFMLGGPGSGKGTQSELLCSQRNMAHLSVGDLLREEIGKPGTSYGPIIEENMRNGRVGPKEITVALLKDAMFKSDTEPSSRLQFVIDGKMRWQFTNGPF